MFNRITSMVSLTVVCNMVLKRVEMKRATVGGQRYLCQIAQGAGTVRDNARRMRGERQCTAQARATARYSTTRRRRGE
eukprot:6182865-Pleurochrysis_carterae.AAC.1